MQDAYNFRIATEIVKSRFETLADTYEKTLETFKYFGVDHMARVFQRFVSDATRKNQFDILDLGCGTGLCGQQFKRFAARLDGVDLSPKMLELAHGLRIYDQLDCVEVSAYFTQEPHRKYEVITSAGLFVYLPELQAVLNNCFSILQNDGCIVFTVDQHDGIVPDVLPSARSALMFTYSRAYVERCLQSAGFRIIALEQISDRLNWQNREPVPAIVVLAIRPG